MLEYGDMLFRSIKKVRSVTSLRNTSYYQSLYIFLLEQELLIIRELEPEQEIWIEISANGRNRIRFVFSIQTKFGNETVTILEQPLTDRQFTKFMRGNGNGDGE